MFGDAPAGRPSGRGTPTDPDIPQGRAYVAPPERPQVRPGEEPPIDDDMREALRAFLPTPEMRPRIVLRFADEKDLLISGMLAGRREPANQPAVVGVPGGKGRGLLLTGNALWRNATRGSYFLQLDGERTYES